MSKLAVKHDADSAGVTYGVGDVDGEYGGSDGACSRNEAVEKNRSEGHISKVCSESYEYHPLEAGD